jgi:hypothetical protein
VTSGRENMKFNTIFSILFLSIVVLIESSSGLWIIDSIRKYFNVNISESSREVEEITTTKLSPVIFGEFSFGGVRD